MRKVVCENVQIVGKFHAFEYIRKKNFTFIGLCDRIMITD